MLPFTTSNSLTYWHNIVLGWKFLTQFWHTIKQFMFEVEHRIVVTDGRFEQPFRIIRCRRNDNFYAGSVEEPGFRAGGMEWSALDATAGGTTNDHRHWNTGAPVHLCCHVDNLIEAAGDEVDKLHLSDGTHAHQRSAYGRADDSSFSHRCIDNSFWSKLFK